MGILLLGLGYISSKSIFFIGATITALVFITLIFRELHGKRWAQPGYGRDFEGIPEMGIGGGTSGMMHYHSIAMAAGMDAFNEDTDVGAQRRNIVSILANNSEDNNQTQSNIDQIIRRVHGDQQPAGPLDELIQERIDGTITPAEYRQKLLEYIRQIAHEHGVPMRERKMMHNLPSFVTHPEVESQPRPEEIEQIQQQAQVQAQVPPFPAFPSVSMPTLPPNIPPDVQARIQDMFQQRIAQAQQRYNMAGQRYNMAFGLG